LAPLRAGPETPGATVDGLDQGHRRTSVARVRGRGCGLAEVLLEDLERRWRRRRAAVPAVLDQDADDERGRVERAVAAPPRLALEMADRIARQVDDLLGRSRLAGDLDREGA